MHRSNTAPLGVYDSGLGGLTVWRTIRERLPRERVVYYGDTAHVPYGGRPAEEILGFSRYIVSYLASCGAKLIVAACNTSSALALPHLVDSSPVPLIGMVEPSLAEAIDISRNHRIGLMATEGTVGSGLHARWLQESAPNHILYSKACPRLVPLIEAGHRSGADLTQAVTEYVKPLVDAQVDCIILGCTHYPLIADIIQAAVGNVKLIDPARAVADLVANTLTSSEQVNSSGAGEDKVYVSGDPNRFLRAAESLGFDLGVPVEHAAAVPIVVR